MTKLTPIAVAHGDGIGPEIMAATLKILTAAGAAIAPQTIDVGEKVYLSGINSGITPAAWESLRATRVLLKAPITTPIGEGYKSLNVTIRKTLGLFANVRPCVSYHPFVSTKHPALNVVIVRENEEDLYAGVEYQQSHDVAESLKLISRPASERIVRYAFDYARRNGRKKVTCFHKANIMKQTDGLFLQCFKAIAAEYPDIINDTMIIDIGTAKLAAAPEKFDVIVTLNLYGDIISDVAGELTGSVGLGASSNIGSSVAMFEAIHGSAPDIAGKNIANPSGLLLSAVMMLVHIGQEGVASTIHNAWLATLEAGIHTPDLYRPEHSKQKVGTAEFADAVIARLGQLPRQFTPVAYQPQPPVAIAPAATSTTPPAKLPLVGADIFVTCHGFQPAQLAALLLPLVSAPLTLELISNRGVKVWPDGASETLLVDRWRCRFRHPQLTPIDYQLIMDLQQKILGAGLEIAKIETLRTLGGKPAYAAAQGA